MTDQAPDFKLTDTPPKRGPGRPRKDGTSAKPSTAASAADVKKALATLDSAYDLIATGLLIAGFTDSAKSWVDSVANLQASNAAALNASPALARSISRVGSTGGAMTFYVTNGMALAGVYKSVMAELAERRLAREAEESLKEPAVGFDPLIP